ERNVRIELGLFFGRRSAARDLGAPQLARSFGAGELGIGPSGNAADALVGSQLRVGEPHHFVGIGARLEDQYSMNAIASDYRGFAHARLPVQHAFDIFGEDVEPLRRYDHLLLAAEDGEFASFFEDADVAGAKPSAFEGLRGFFGPLIVA